MTFTWGDKEDLYLYENGVTILWMQGRTKAIQKFVEELSYKIGFKVDFSFTAGRAHIDVNPKGVDAAIKVINDDEWMKKFIVPHTEKSFNNETWCQII